MPSTDEQVEGAALKKRPVAFRWQTPSGGWVYSGDEAVAAVLSGGDYQGLYVRDGTPPAVCPD